MTTADLTGWISAIGTVVAALGAIVLGVLVWRLERSRDQSSEAEQRRQQAAKVCGWYGHDREMTAEGVVLPRRWYATIRNASELPVYNVRVALHLSSHPAPDGSVLTETQLGIISTLPPQSDREFVVSDSTGRRMNHEDPYVVSFGFRDAAGIRWYRDMDGRLKEVPEE